ncbi:MAG: NAD-dependent epimerase/dehydratase family protein, partial [bacterium]
LGGSGFVGSAFARLCSAEGRDFSIIDRRNYDSFVGGSCEVLINANGNSKKHLSQQAPLRDFDASVRTVRASLVDLRYDRYVYLSSCDVYPDCSSPRVTSESQKLDVSMQSSYGFHKYLAEQCIRHGGSKWLIVRLGGAVGPGLNKNPIFDVLAGEALWVDPESEFQFLHTDRAAKTVMSLLDCGTQNEVFNVCGRGVVSVREVMQWAGRDVSVRAGSPRIRYEVDINKVSALIDVPETRSTVRAFVYDELRARSALNVPAPNAK